MLHARAAHGAPVEHAWEIDGNTSSVPPELAFQNVAANTAVHVHSTADWASFLQAAHKAQHVKLVITLHDCSILTGGCAYPLECPGWREGCFNPCPRNFSAAHARQAWQIALVNELQPICVAPSQWLARMARHVWPDLGCHVVPNGVEWPGSTPNVTEARRQLDIPANARIALFAAHGGEAAAYKAGGQWRAVWEHIKKAAPDCTGFFVGGREYGREGDLFFWPYLDRGHMQTMLAAVDALLYPSLADNHPLLILEAMAAGTPVAASAIGGVPEQVRDNATGLLAKAGNSTGLAAAGARLLTDRRLARSLAQAAWEQGSEKFTVERMFVDYEKIYASL